MKIHDAILKRDIEMLRGEIAKGNVNSIEPETGYTDLHYCAQEQELEFAKMLIENGAYLNIKDKFGNTPLSKAVYFSGGKVEMINLLLSSGANADIENNYGISARQLAHQIASFDVKACFENETM